MPADSPLCCGTWTERAASWSRRPPISAAWPWAPSPGHLSSISRFWLPEILRDFAQHYPGITVSIRESGQEELDEWLREGSVDLAFCSYHENSQNHWIPFLEDEIWAVVPDGHPLAGCEELSLAQLASEPFILEDRAYDYDISRVIQEAGVHPNVRWTSKDELAILAMVRLELGVSVMPALYLHEDHPGVTVRPLVPRPTGSWAPPCPIWTVSPRRPPVSRSRQKDHGGYALSLVCSLDFFPFSVLKEKCYMA
ncbi:MAG: LysR family transcriptional regulator substrate-binding protein [Evtepia gabavorous]